MRRKTKRKLKRRTKRRAKKRRMERRKTTKRRTRRMTKRKIKKKVVMRKRMKRKKMARTRKKMVKKKKRRRRKRKRNNLQEKPLGKSTTTAKRTNGRPVMATAHSKLRISRSADITFFRLMDHKVLPRMIPHNSKSNTQLSSMIRDIQLLRRSILSHQKFIWSTTTKQAHICTQELLSTSMSAKEKASGCTKTHKSATSKPLKVQLQVHQSELLFTILPLKVENHMPTSILLQNQQEAFNINLSNMTRKQEEPPTLP